MTKFPLVKPLDFVLLSKLVKFLLQSLLAPFFGGLQMPTLEMPRITIQSMTLAPEILARVGHDSPPVLPARRELRPAERAPRELRETRRHMTYHWF